VKLVLQNGECEMYRRILSTEDLIKQHQESVVLDPVKLVINYPETKESLMKIIRKTIQRVLENYLSLELYIKRRFFVKWFSAKFFRLSIKRSAS
jgi:hypothetical protein